MGLDSEAPRWRSIENELLRSCSYQDEEDEGEGRRGGLSAADLQLSAWAGSGAKLVHSGSEGWMKWQVAAERGQPFSPWLGIRLPWMSKN